MSRHFIKLFFFFITLLNLQITNRHCHISIVKHINNKSKQHKQNNNKINKNKINIKIILKANYNLIYN